MHLQERQNGVALPPSTSGTIVKVHDHIMTS